MPLFGLKGKRKLSTPSLSYLGLRKTQSTGNIEDTTERIALDNPHSSNVVIIKKPTMPSTDTIGILRSPSSKRPPTPPPTQPVIEIDDEDDTMLADKLKNITACDMDLLLSLETQARMDCQEEKEVKKQQRQIRPSKIKFELPITPPRSRSPDPLLKQRRWSVPDENKTKKQGRLTRWSRLIKQQQQEEAQHNKALQQSNNSSSGSDTEDDEFDSVVEQQSNIVIGSKVKLFKRPLPIVGTVKYIGPVHFEAGEWLGIELDSRVGNTDGKIDDKRYFQTNLHSGIFVKREDTIKV